MQVIDKISTELGSVVTVILRDDSYLILCEYATCLATNPVAVSVPNRGSAYKVTMEFNNTIAQLEDRWKASQFKGE